MFNRLPAGLTAILALVLVLSFPAVAQVPGLGTSSEPESQTALQQFIDEAKADGSTVIVVQPGRTNETTVDETRAMRAEVFLAARQRTIDMLAEAHRLPGNITATFWQASPRGSLWWLLRAFGTAVLGVLLANFVTVRAFRWAQAHYGWEVPDTADTTAEKVGFLFSRIMRSAVLLTLSLFVAFTIAVVLDSGYEPTRRVIFDLLVTYILYRFLRHGFSFNLFAPDAPQQRLVNINDDEATRLHRHFHVTVAIVAAIAAPLRSLMVIGEQQIAAGAPAGLTSGDINLLQLALALLVTIATTAFTIGHFGVLQRMLAPRNPNAAFFKARRLLANFLPVGMVLYGLAAFATFGFRLIIGAPAPSAVIAAPFVILFVAAMVYAILIIIIDAFYRRRRARFEEKVREAMEQAAEVQGETLAEGEEMVSGLDAPEMVYRPIFRDFLEHTALAVVAVFALGELGRFWGVPVMDEGNWWAATLDIVLAVLLGWIAYRAVSAWVDHRLEQEGGPPELDEEAMGNEGGAGSSRVATLLPIVRWLLIAVIVVAGAMIVLSEFGVDIGPIFAGAGVVGIAVGFGAQKLIQDVFSGAFFLLDDAFRKGEYVEIENVKGVVEKISIRSFQLRHHLGALHTIPFGEIHQLTNYSRDWVMMKLPLRVTYDTDVEKVRKLVKKLGQRLLEHDQIGHTFMQPLKSQGVYAMEDSAMIIRVKFMTKPGEQFVTRKVVYQEIQDLFAREGIHFAHKEVTVRLADGEKAENLSEEQKKTVTAAARSVIDAEQEEAAAAGKKAPAGP